MEIFTVLGSFGFIFRFAYKLTGLVFLWWRKEYRFDRMMIHLHTKQGVRLWGGQTHAVLLVFIFLWFVYPSEVVLNALSLCVAFVGIGYVRKVQTWMLPPITPKVIVMVAGMILLFVTFVLTVPLPIFITLAISDLLMFPFTVFFVGLVTIPTIVYHRWVIAKATRILATHKRMMIIGITGSYGKTSVKEYLATVFSTKYKALRTEASKNSSIGIAEIVLKHLSPDHEVFVVEMGAYKRGEIRKMARMVKPEIGVITAINPQHQDLFGSIETTMRAKYELAQGLVGKRVLIANADDERVRIIGAWAKQDGCRVVWYSVKQNAQNIKTDVSGTEFDCLFGKEKAHVKTSVIGEHQVSNILAAIAGAKECGMRLKDAALGAVNIQPATGVMEVKKGINGSIFIDDTFNNNPDAAKAAIAFLSKNKGKKFLVFQPMIELGSYADSSHEEVGAAAAEVADAILVTNNNWFKAFEKGVRTVSKSVPLMQSTPNHAAYYLRQNVLKGDMVLFKGKDAKHVMDILQ